MRKIYALLLLTCGFVQAQVPNADFESGTGYGLENVTAWGKFFVFQITIDMETGESTQDDIIFGDNTIGMFCTSTTDAHSGERAMLIRNAFNVTQNQVIPGEANLFNTEIADTPTGWNFGVPVEAGADFDFLSFWYKFAPLGNDVAEAKLTLFADGVGEVGSAKILISGAESEYTYATVPVTFTSIETPTFMTISFTMQAEGSTAVFGSYLTVDDLKVNNSPLGLSQFNTQTFSVFPTIAEATVHVQGTFTGKYHVGIANAEGRIVKETAIEMQSGATNSIDVSQLASGVYFLKIENGNQSATKKFIKK